LYFRTSANVGEALALFPPVEMLEMERAMEWIKGQMFTSDGFSVQFSEPVKANENIYRMVHYNGYNAYPVYPDGTLASCVVDVNYARRIIHRPPVPAPCEHKWRECVGGRICDECGKFEVLMRRPAPAACEWHNWFNDYKLGVWCCDKCGATRPYSPEPRVQQAANATIDTLPPTPAPDSVKRADEMLRRRRANPCGVS
jgi:hypothetical protein